MIAGKQLWGFSFILLATAAIVACSSDKGSTVIAGPKLPSFNDITSATPKIQTAAKAVVRVRIAGGSGTGSFISPTGLLLTNNHVLGDVMCPTEGCYLEITLMHQRNQARREPSIVFGMPQAVDIGLDMAVVQLYTQPGGAQVDSPDYLQFNAQDSNTLLGKHVTIVGHPEGYLKKWTDGTVVDATGDWLTSTVYTLPGNSGSPILDDDGKIVGLLHRGPSSEDLFTDDGVNMYSIGTASGPITAAMTNSLPTTMLSALAATTADAFVTNNLVYLNAQVSTVTVDGASASALTLLGNACDAGLARTDFMTPDDLNTALMPCYSAELWLECRSDAGAVSYDALCPSTSDASAWAERFQSVNRLWEELNGTIDYSSVSFAIAALQSSMAGGVTAGAQSLQAVISAVNPSLDFGLAYYLAAFGIASYDGTSIHDYVINYAQVPHYELRAQEIAYAASWLWGHGSMSKNDLVTFVKRLRDDSKVSVGAQLAIEDFLYQLDSL